MKKFRLWRTRRRVERYAKLHSVCVVHADNALVNEAFREAAALGATNAATKMVKNQRLATDRMLNEAYQAARLAEGGK